MGLQMAAMLKAFLAVVVIAACCTNAEFTTPDDIVAENSDSVVPLADAIEAFLETPQAEGSQVAEEANDSAEHEADNDGAGVETVEDGAEDGGDNAADNGGDTGGDNDTHKSEAKELGEVDRENDEKDVQEDLDHEEDDEDDRGVGAEYGTKEHPIDGTIDDDSDYRANEVNSEGFNKLVGPGPTSHTDDEATGGHVKPPGYSYEDTITDSSGHYYIGPSRRRVGAGFGRRRRSTPAPTAPPTPKSEVPATSAPTPPVPEILKPVKEEIKDDEEKKDEEEQHEAEVKAGSGSGPNPESEEKEEEKEEIKIQDSDLSKNEVTEAGEEAIKTIEGETPAPSPAAHVAPVVPTVAPSPPTPPAADTDGAASEAEATAIGQLPTPPPATPAPETPAPSPSTPPAVQVRVTTGVLPYAASGQKPTVTMTGTTGTFTGTITTGGEGDAATTTFHPESDIGVITAVVMKASSNDGWLLTKFETNVNGRGWKQHGCLPYWLDGTPHDKIPYEFPYGHTLNLKPGVCVSSYPAAWGAKTKTGCFCKLTGVEGTCGLNGSTYNWCRTRDSCKGTASSHGAWDKC